VTLLRDLAISANAGLLLTSHPSLTGISTGSGLSGSTAWNASVRSRLYFKRAKTEKDEEPDPDLRVLEVMKSNYGPVGENGHGAVKRRPVLAGRRREQPGEVGGGAEG
jgi:hypothetical protein